MKNIITAKGLRAQMETFASLPNLNPAMQDFLQSGIKLIDHVFDDKYSQFYKDDWEFSNRMGRVLDRAQKLMDEIVHIAELEKRRMEEEKD